MQDHTMSPPARLAELRLWWACVSAISLKPSPVLQAHALRWLAWLPQPCHRRCMGGFTLAEVLIALAILGVIATFTIPKVLQAQQDASYNAKAKEAMAALSNAYWSLRLQRGDSAAIDTSELTQYVNYTKIDTSRNIDHKQTSGAIVLACNAGGGACLDLVNGGTIKYLNSTLGGSPSRSASTSAIEFLFDPDGIVTDGTTNGPGKSLNLFLYFNGRITTRGNITPNTCTPSCFGSPSPSSDPPWFHWD
jgi:prepilin-type N-terminal cleavage/methylation domain-containing protein